MGAMGGLSALAGLLLRIALAPGSRATPYSIAAQVSFNPGGWSG